MKPWRWMTALLVAIVGLSTLGCTVVKPVAGAFVYPFATLKEHMSNEDEGDEGRFKPVPPVLAIPTAIVVLPIAFVALSAGGAVGGLTSGIASDLNLLLGHADMDDTRESLRYPFRTNMRRESE